MRFYIVADQQNDRLLNLKIFKRINRIGRGEINGVVVLRLQAGVAQLGQKRVHLDMLLEDHLAIGPHALIQEDVHFDRLGLAIIDEALEVTDRYYTGADA